jgi:hypothetical protein
MLKNLLMSGVAKTSASDAIDMHISSQSGQEFIKAREAVLAKQRNILPKHHNPKTVKVTVADQT